MAIIMVLWHYKIMGMDNMPFGSISLILGKNLSCNPGFGQVLVLVEIGLYFIIALWNGRVGYFSFLLGRTKCVELHDTFYSFEKRSIFVKLLQLVSFLICSFSLQLRTSCPPVPESY